jgi:hypothetical protein
MCSNISWTAPVFGTMFILWIVPFSYARKKTWVRKRKSLLLGRNLENFHHILCYFLLISRKKKNGKKWVSKARKETERSNTTDKSHFEMVVLRYWIFLISDILLRVGVLYLRHHVTLVLHHWTLTPSLVRKLSLVHMKQCLRCHDSHEYWNILIFLPCLLCYRK